MRIFSPIFVFSNIYYYFFHQPCVSLLALLSFALFPSVSQFMQLHVCVLNKKLLLLISICVRVLYVRVYFAITFARDNANCFKLLNRSLNLPSVISVASFLDHRTLIDSLACKAALPAFTESRCYIYIVYGLALRFNLRIVVNRDYTKSRRHWAR